MNNMHGDNAHAPATDMTICADATDMRASIENGIDSESDKGDVGPRHLPHEVATLVLDRLGAIDAQKCLLDVNVFGLADPRTEAARQRCMRTKKAVLVRRGDMRALCYLAARGTRFHMRHVQVAAAHGHVDAVKWLLAQGVQGTRGCGAIESAAAGGHTNVLSCLLAHDCPRSVHKGTLRAALLTATLYGHRDAANLLSNALDTAPEPMMLLVAALAGDVVVIESLLAAHPHWARLCAHVDFCHLTLEASDQWVPSTWSVFWNHRCARQMVAVGHTLRPRVHAAPFWGRPTTRRLDLVGAACVSGNVDAVRALWAAGAGARDAWCEHLAAWAALGGNSDVLAFVASKRVEIERAGSDDAGPGSMRVSEVLKAAAISRGVGLVQLAWTLFDRPHPHDVHFLWRHGTDLMRFALDNDVVNFAARARLAASGALCDADMAAYLIQHHRDQLADVLSVVRPWRLKSVEAARLLFDHGLVTFTAEDVTRAIIGTRIDVVRYLVDERGLGMAPANRCRPDLLAHVPPTPEPDADGLCRLPSILVHICRQADVGLIGCLLDRCLDPAERAHHVDAVLCASVAFGRSDLFEAMLARRAADPTPRTLIFSTPIYSHPLCRLSRPLFERLVVALGTQGIDFGYCYLLPRIGKRCLPIVDDLCRRGLYDPTTECAHLKDASEHPPALVSRSIRCTVTAVFSRAVIAWLAARGVYLARIGSGSCALCRGSCGATLPSSHIPRAGEEEN